MKYNSEIHHRKSIRLKHYDYSQAGAYFITICARNRECLFGEIVDGEMVINEYGNWVEYTWRDLPNHNSNVELDTFIIMPNHIHGIIIIHDAIVGAGSEPAPTHRQVRDYEREIDELACLCVSARRQVYKLYELTPEEIEIVENKRKV